MTKTIALILLTFVFTPAQAEPTLVSVSAGSSLIYKSVSLEGNYFFGRGHHGMGLLWATQDVSFFQNYKDRFWGPLYTFRTGILQLRAGLLVEYKRAIHRNIVINSPENEVIWGSGFLTGAYIRYPLRAISEQFLLGHGVDLLAVDSGNDETSKDFLAAKLTALEVGFAF